MWIVVNFIKDNTVAVVPKAWLKDGMCPWDSGKMCQKLIKQLSLPNPNFEQFEATQISTFQTDNYEVALQKARKAEDTLNLSCDDESSLLQPRRRNPNILHSDFITGESSKVTEPPSLDAQLAHLLSEASNILNLDDAIPVTHTDNNQHDNPVVETNDYIRKNVLDENANDKTSSASGGCCNCKDLISEFNLLRVHVEANQKWISNKVDDIYKKIQDLFTMTSLHSAGADDMNWKFPMESLEDLDRFENDLKDPDFKRKMLQRLSRVGGSCAEDTTRRLWKYLLTVELQYKCNWSGLKDKRPLKDTLLNELLQDAVRQCFGTATLKTIQVTTKDYIQHASNRLPKFGPKSKPK